MTNRKEEVSSSDYTEWLYERLKNKNAACNHLQAAFEAYEEDLDSEALLLAVRDVAKAQGGVRWLSEETDLNREHLYRLLSGRGNPRLDTLAMILKAFGLRIKITPTRKTKSSKQ